MEEFKNKYQLIDWVVMMQTQNLNGRETEDELFRLGIEFAIDEMEELGLLKIKPILDEIKRRRDKNRCFCGSKWNGITCNSCGFDATESDIY